MVFNVKKTFKFAFLKDTKVKHNYLNVFFLFMYGCIKAWRTHLIQILDKFLNFDVILLLIEFLIIFFVIIQYV